MILLYWVINRINYYYRYKITYFYNWWLRLIQLEWNFVMLEKVTAFWMIRVSVQFAHVYMKRG